MLVKTSTDKSHRAEAQARFNFIAVGAADLFINRMGESQVHWRLRSVPY